MVREGPIHPNCHTKMGRVSRPKPMETRTSNCRPRFESSLPTLDCHPVDEILTPPQYSFPKSMTRGTRTFYAAQSQMLSHAVGTCVAAAPQADHCASPPTSSSGYNCNRIFSSDHPSPLFSPFSGPLPLQHMLEAFQAADGELCHKGVERMKFLPSHNPTVTNQIIYQKP